MILLYFTTSSKKEAEKISNSLLKKKLIACANIHESTSIYNWKGKKVQEKESIVFCKTSAKKASAAEKEIARIHSYEVPCILRLPVLKANPAYAKWVESEVG